MEVTLLFAPFFQLGLKEEIRVMLCGERKIRKKISTCIKIVYTLQNPENETEKFIYNEDQITCSETDML